MALLPRQLASSVCSVPSSQDLWKARIRLSRIWLQTTESAYHIILVEYSGFRALKLWEKKLPAGILKQSHLENNFYDILCYLPILFLKSK